MKSHLKRLAIPRSWDVNRKKTVYIARPLPGGSPKDMTMPLQVLLRDILKFAKTAKEVRYILHNKEVIINGKRRKESRFPVGLMDVMVIPDLKKAYRMMLNTKGKLLAVEIKPDQAKFKLCKIKNKTSGKKGTQLNFSDGSNVIVSKDTYKTYDVVVLEFEKNKIKDHFKFDKESPVFLIGGKKVGHTGKILDIKDKYIIIKTDKGEFETAKRYAFVIGKDKPAIEIPK